MADLRKAFSKIYDQNVGRIYRFVFLKVNSQDIAEDITADTFLKGWQAFQDKQAKIDNPKAFLYQISRNLVIDYYRQKDRTQTEPADTVIDYRSDIGQQVSLGSDIDQIRKLLPELNQDYQDVIIWHYLDDLPIPEVARLLKRSEEATRVLLSRALKSLRKKLPEA